MIADAAAGGTAAAAEKAASEWSQLRELELYSGRSGIASDKPRQCSGTQDSIYGSDDERAKGISFK